MADTYLGRLQSMFSDPYMAGGGRPVASPLTPMQQAALAGPQGMPAAPSPMATGELSRIAPGRAWPTPASQNFQTVGGPRQIGGPMRPAAPYTPNFTMPGPSYPIEPMRYPSPAMAAPGGVAPPSPAPSAPRFGGMVTDATPRLPAPTSTSPGLMSRMLGLGARAGRLLGGPVGVGLTAATMIPSAIDALRGSNPQTAEPQGDPESQVFADMGGSYAAPEAMPTSDMAAAAVPPVSSVNPQAAGGMDAMPFGQAFARARAAGMPQFMWRGRPFTTEVAAPAPAMPAAVITGPNPGIDDDTRQRAMAWLALNQSGL